MAARNAARNGAASARAVLNAPRDMTARLRIAWDDRLVLRVGGNKPIDLGTKTNFDSRDVEVALKQGSNPIAITLSNTRNYNHGGFVFSMHATARDGSVLKPGVDTLKP